MALPQTVLVSALGLALWVPPLAEETSAFRLALAAAERSLGAGEFTKSRELIERALERDKKSVDAWNLRARWAAAIDDRDELVYALHQEYRLSVAQGAAKDAVAGLRARLEEVDPIAKALLGMDERFIGKLAPIAEKYEKGGRPHSAIRVWKQVLSLDPENAEAQAAIERIASTPDPSLAGDAKPKDLFEDVSEEWIAEFNETHGEWDTRAELERENYKTYTDAGYEVLVRAAEAMEQMNAFYRVFFQYGTEEDGKSVPRIGLNIFKNREEYLELGIGPPVEWSGGHFTGSFVETYIGQGGFESMTGTLFHEAAHQFVSLATSATGWLNEGLASFFEGTRILPNGTVIMNMPANHRLNPLANRMSEGWMTSHDDGLDSEDPNQTPTKAPTFRIILENKYSWGPPWYAPTWGLVYFLYNYQDPIDGRFVYRDSFHEFINSSGGRSGDGAVRNFEEVVLANPKRPLKGVERPDDAPAIKLPKTAEELDELWKEWTLALREEQRGLLEVERPYKLWGRYAAENGDYVIAQEHYEKGLVETPDDIELLFEFAELLNEHFANADRAAKLVLEAITFIESQTPVDQKKLKECERLLKKLDPKHRTLAVVQDEMAADGRIIVERYQRESLPMMVMDVSWRLATKQNLPDLFEFYESAVRSSGKSLKIWDLAYNENDLEGWNTAGIESSFRADGTFISSEFGEFDPALFDYQFLTLDQITTGDFSMDADVLANKGEVNFCGFVFGRKGTDFHGLVLFPGKVDVAEGTVDTGYLQLMTSVDGAAKVWRNNPVQMRTEDGRSSAGEWHKLRIDVAGRFVDIWFDGRLLATHEFPSREVVQGSFGLLTGPGKARFRNVRYAASDPRDPAARIEREVRLEALVSESGGGPIDNSYLGIVPPWPPVASWLQSERRSWDDRGAVPQLLVFFSLHQNNIVPIDGWLRDLAKRNERYGLEIVCVVSPNDADALDSWLVEHPLPGAVAVDYREGTGIGKSFEAFLIQRFNLPRLLLLDLDQKVVWEGDPGLPAGEDEGPPYDTYLADPLEELIAKRKLPELQSWRTKWTATCAPALHRGAVEVALPILREAAEFDGAFDGSVTQAQSFLTDLEAAMGDLKAAGRAIQSREADPAFEALLAWSPSFDITIDKAFRKQNKRVLESSTSKDWASALKRCAKIAERKRLPEAEDVDRFVSFLKTKSGIFAEDLLRDLEQSQSEGDFAQVQALARSAPERPARWLAQEYFGW